MTLSLYAVENAKKCKLIEKNKLYFNTTTARGAKLLESIEIFEKAECFSGEFEIKNIVCQVYGSKNYVCNDEKGQTCEVGINGIVVSETAAGPYEELAKQLYVHRIEPLKLELHSSSTNRSVSVLVRQKLGSYKLFKKKKLGETILARVSLLFLLSRRDSTARMKDSCLFQFSTFRTFPNEPNTAL